MNPRARKWLIRMLSLLLSVCVVLLVGCTVYDAWAEREMVRQMKAAEREPGTPYLKGGAPVRIDRGRDRVCVLLHGFPSTPADFGDLPAALDEAGWDVWAPLLPGFGTDAGDLAQVSAEEIVAGAGHELDRMRASYRRVVLLGFSMGGAVALVLSERSPPDALVLVNPFLRARHKVRYVLSPRTWHRVCSAFVDHVVKPPWLVHVERREARARLVAYRAMPLRAVGEAFRIADLGRAAAPADVPVLVLLSEQDGAVSPAAVRAAYEAFEVGEKSIATFERSDHLLFLDHDREAAIEAVLRFIDRLDSPADREPDDEDTARQRQSR
ncbi:MAG: alpha/beta fold hydrolase [Candidatus Brocadiia bacterium]|jgi:carboxylesterase|nr:alpha/beta fold hydrolase [Candidatus Brocadiia bacterium]